MGGKISAAMLKLAEASNYSAWCYEKHDDLGRMAESYRKGRHVSSADVVQLIEVQRVSLLRSANLAIFNATADGEAEKEAARPKMTAAPIGLLSRLRRRLSRRK